MYSYQILNSLVGRSLYAQFRQGAAIDDQGLAGYKRGTTFIAKEKDRLGDFISPANSAARSSTCQLRLHCQHISLDEMPALEAIIKHGGIDRSGQNSVDPD